MGSGTSVSNKVAGTIAVTAMAAAALATFGSAPAAHATCASLFGIGNNADCTSTPVSIAIGIGTGAKAQANGLFGSAFALGTNASAKTLDAFTFGSAVGDSSSATGGGLFGVATALGPKTIAQTAGNPVLGKIGFNIALNVSPANQTGLLTVAGGVGNLAVNLFGVNSGQSPSLEAYGIASSASSVGGENNRVQVAGDFLAVGFSILGNGNFVGAGLGPVAIAGSIAQVNKPVTKFQPGININGIRIPNTAAATNRDEPKPSAATGPATRRTTDAAAAETGARSAGKGTGRSARK